MFTTKSGKNVSVNEEEIIARASVGKGETIEVVIGTYEQSIEQPELSIEVTQGTGEGLSASLKRTEGRGDYSLLYHLDNTAGTNCEVAIREHFS